MDLSSETFVVEFYVARRFLNEPQWEEACWDEALRLAHQQGKIPVGPILITTSDVDTASGALVEGVPMSLMPLFAATAPKGVVKVTASCMIGAEL